MAIEEIAPYIGQHCAVVFEADPRRYDAYVGFIQAVDASTISVVRVGGFDGAMSHPKAFPAVPKPYPHGGRIPIERIRDITPR
jgi:hypothetical protein